MADYVSTVKLVADTKQLQKGLDNANKKVGALKGSVGKLGGLLGGLAVGSGIKTAITEFGQYETALKQVVTLGAEFATSAEDIKKITDASSLAFGKDAAGQATAYYNIISAGAKDAKTAQELLTASNKLAITGNADLVASQSILSSALNVYASKGETATSISDKLFATVQQGVTTVPELANAMGRVTATAQAAGLEFDELGGFLASVTAGGIQTNEAVSGIKAALANIIKPSKAAKDAAAELGLQFDTNALKSKGLVGFMESVKEATGGNVDTMAQLFGSVEALNTVMTVVSEDGFAKLQDATTAVKDSGGTVAREYGGVADSLEVQMSKATATFDKLKREVGSALAPVMMDLLEAVTPLIQGFADFVSQEPGLTKLGVALAAVGAAVALVGAPVIAATAAIAGAIAIYQNWGDITEWFSDIWNTFKDDFSKGMDKLLTPVREFSDFVSGLIDDITALIDKISEFDVLGSAKDAITGTVGSAVDAVTGFFSDDDDEEQEPQKFATGGRVIGPGTGTSDSIPAMLSNGEFVVNAKATRNNLRLLEAMNSGRKIPGLATGTPVTGYTADAMPSVESRMPKYKSLVKQIENLNKSLSKLTEGTDKYNETKTKLDQKEKELADKRTAARARIERADANKAERANSAAKKLKKLGDAAETTEQRISQAFGGVFDSAENLGKSLSGGVGNFLDNLGNSLKDFAKNQMKTALSGAGRSLLSSAWGKGSTTANFLSGILGFATGGHVSGPGTGTSDSILARLSNGEYVVNAQAAAANRGLLDSINYGYSNGGVAGEKGGKKKKGVLGDMEDMFIHMFGSAFGKTAAQIAPRENLDRFGLGKGEGKGVFSPASRDFLRATERQSSLVDRLLTTESRKSELQGLSSMQRAQFEKGVRSLDSRGRFRKSDEVLAAITGGRLGTSRGKKEEQMLLDIAAGRRSNWVSSSGKAIGGLTHSFASDDPRMAAVRSAKAQGAADARSSLGGGSQLALMVKDIGRSMSGGIGLAQDASRRAENILSQSRNVRVGSQIGVGQASWQGGRAVGSISSPSKGSNWRDNFSSGSGTLLTAGQKGFQAQNLAIKKAETNMMKGIGGFKTGGSVYAAGKARKPAKRSLPKFRNGGSVSVMQGGMNNMPPITVNQTNNITATSDVDFQTKLAQNADLVANMVRREAATRGRRPF